MAVDEAARHQLYNDLVDVLGPESTGTIMELLPPVGWAEVATKHDLTSLENAFEAGFHSLRAVYLADDHTGPSPSVQPAELDRNRGGPAQDSLGGGR